MKAINRIFSTHYLAFAALTFLIFGAFGCSDSGSESRSESRPKTESASKSDPKSESKSEPKSESVSKSEPKSDSKFESESESGPNWQNELAGKKLSRAQTSGSLSGSMQIWFCSSGEYMGKQESSGYSTGGSGTLSTADEDSDSGKWSVNSSTLTLRSKNGDKTELQLSQGTDKKVIRLNGTGFLVERHNDNCSED